MSLQIWDWTTPLSSPPAEITVYSSRHSGLCAPQEKKVPIHSTVVNHQKKSSACNSNIHVNFINRVVLKCMGKNLVPLGLSHHQIRILIDSLPGGLNTRILQVLTSQRDISAPYQSVLFKNAVCEVVIFWGNISLTQIMMKTRGAESLDKICIHKCMRAGNSNCTLQKHWGRQGTKWKYGTEAKRGSDFKRVLKNYKRRR